MHETSRCEEVECGRSASSWCLIPEHAARKSFDRMELWVLGGISEVVCNRTAFRISINSQAIDEDSRTVTELLEIASSSWILVNTLSSSKVGGTPSWLSLRNYQISGLSEWMLRYNLVPTRWNIFSYRRLFQDDPTRHGSWSFPWDLSNVFYILSNLPIWSALLSNSRYLFITRN